MTSEVEKRKANYQVHIRAATLTSLGLGAIGPFLLILIQDLSGSIGVFTFAIGLTGFVDSSMSYVAGKLSDRFGRKIFIVSSGFIRSGLFLCYPFVDFLWQLYVLQIMMGINGAVSYTATIAFEADITAKETRGSDLGKLDAATGIASAAAMILGGQLVERFEVSVNLIFYVVAGILFLATLIRLRYLNEER